jgi:hypothetical protein
MTHTKDEALRMALEALEKVAALTGARWALEQGYAGHLEAITAIKQALAAPVQEPVAWVDLLKQAEEVVRSKPLWKKYIDGTPLANDIAVWMASFAQEHITPPAQPAVPDAMTSADIQEHIEYVAGWNECRQAMLEMTKNRSN